jgi:carboxymethylenebutenolidase
VVFAPRHAAWLRLASLGEMAMRFLLLVVLALTMMAPSCGKGSRDSGGVPTASAVPPPPGEEDAKAALDRSPRHGELVDVPLDSGDSIRVWVVYPERSDKAGVVMVIHEIYGLSDWIRGVADQLAAQGFIAVAPDLISGLGPGGGGTESVASRDDVVQLVRGLTPDLTRARLDAVRRWATRLPAANGKLATIGFCWGGSRSFEYAAAEPPIQGAVAYYGATPDSATLQRVTAPILAHYGGDDARVNATIPAAKTALERRAVPYEDHVYPGAGHGFLRAQSQREGANLRAAQESWPRTIAFLRERL